jgi:hypothetical protein
MTFAEIRECIELLLAHAEGQGLSEIALPPSDLYWTVTSQDWRMPYQEPKPGLGSFADDEGELAKLLQTPARASAVDLERVASLLRLLSDRLAGSL